MQVADRRLSARIRKTRLLDGVGHRPAWVRGFEFDRFRERPRSMSVNGWIGVNYMDEAHVALLALSSTIHRSPAVGRSQTASRREEKGAVV